MAKEKSRPIVKIQIQAGAATPAPPVGTALGPHGINIMDFCKAYNAATEYQRGTVIPAEITIYEDRSFTFVTKTPPTPVLLRQAAGIEKGAPTPRRETGRHRHQGAGPRDRRDQDARPQRRSTSRARWIKSRAPPARWASTSSTDVVRLAHAGSDLGRRIRDDARGSSRGSETHARQEVTPTRASRYDREQLHGRTRRSTW